MKNVIPILLICSFSICTFSQKTTKDYIEIESITKIEGLMYNMEKFLNSTHSDLLSSYYNDTLFFLRADLTTPETLRIYAFSVKKKNIWSTCDCSNKTDTILFLGIRDVFKYENGGNYNVNKDFLILMK